MSLLWHQLADSSYPSKNIYFIQTCKACYMNGHVPTPSLRILWSIYILKVRSLSASLNFLKFLKNHVHVKEIIDAHSQSNLCLSSSDDGPIFTFRLGNHLSACNSKCIVTHDALPSSLSLKLTRNWSWPVCWPISAATQRSFCTLSCVTRNGLVRSGRVERVFVLTE